MLEGIFKNILDMSFEASFLIIAVLIVRIVLRKSSKIFRKVLWGLVALRLSVPFSFKSPLSLVPHETEYMADTTMVSYNVESAVTTSAFDWKVVLPYVWVAVSVLFLAYAVLSFVRVKKKVSDAVLFKGNVFQSEKVESPFVFGIINPKIYISYNLKGERLDFVLKHEKTHIKYFDHITKIIGFMILCVHWFNPLVWVSFVLFCKDVELACDELVVKNMTASKRKSYARTLCDMGINDKKEISACPVAFGEVSVKERVKTALSYKKIGKTAIILSVLLCVSVAVCFMTSPEDTVIESPVNTGVSVSETINYAPNEEDTTSVVFEEKKDETVNDEPIETEVQLPEEITVENTAFVIENDGIYEALVDSPKYHGYTGNYYNPYGVENGNSTISNTMPVIKWDISDDMVPDKFANTPSPYRNFYDPATPQSW